MSDELMEVEWTVGEEAPMDTAILFVDLVDSSVSADRVVADSAVKLIISVPTLDAVIPGAANDDIADSVAQQRVVKGGADQILDIT